jgi:hypothetical protein
MAEELEVVYTAAGQLQAHVIKGRLETEGIPVLLSYDSGSTVFALTVDGLGEVRVLVPQGFAERAREILSSEPEWETGDQDPSPV